jgi:hypothetical protein
VQKNHERDAMSNVGFVPPAPVDAAMVSRRRDVCKYARARENVIREGDRNAVR